jgi:hypothetical protein
MKLYFGVITFICSLSSFGIDNIPHCDEPKSCAKTVEALSENKTEKVEELSTVMRNPGGRRTISTKKELNEEDCPKKKCRTTDETSQIKEMLDQTILTKALMNFEAQAYSLGEQMLYYANPGENPAELFCGEAPEEFFNFEGCDLRKIENILSPKREQINKLTSVDLDQS